MNSTVSTCQHCHSPNIISRGYEKTKKQLKRRFVCHDCNKGTYVVINELEPFVSLNDDAEDTITPPTRDVSELEDPDADNRAFVVDEKRLQGLIRKYKGFVVTSVQNDTETFTPAFESLKTYCEKNNYQLLIIPIRYMNPNAMRRPGYCTWDEDLKPYFVENEMHLNDNVKIVGNINIQATAVNPLSGLDHITQGKTTIVGHPQLQMTTQPVNKHLDPIMLSTTGTLSNNNQFSAEKNIPKASYKAQPMRRHSAIVVETDTKQSFHMRQLVMDDTGGFYDIDGYYSPEQFTPHTEHVSALVTGDEHHMWFDPDVMRATYTNSDSLLHTLKPETIVRHDILDCYSVSHHHKKNKFRLYSKYNNNLCDMEVEMHNTMQNIIDTTPEYATNILVESNHNEHITRWLNECEPREEPWNAKLYHDLMYRCLDSIERGYDDPNPLALWAEKEGYLDQYGVIFLERDEPFFIHDILVSMHGDVGPQGARGSAANLSKISERAIIGHSHSPQWLRDIIQVGTSTYLDLEYNNGPSKWMNTHCVIYPNGQCQLINIINGRWKPTWKTV